MANYKPNTKGVIARDTLIPPSKKIGGLVLLIMLPFALLTFILYGILLLVSKLVASIVLGIGIALTLIIPIFFFVILPLIGRKKGPFVYYLETDTVSSVVMTTEVRRRLSHRTKRYVYTTYYNYTVSFKSQRSITYTYSQYDTPVNRFPTMKNGEDIPRHMPMIQALTEGDMCYLHLCEGDDNRIIDIFDTKYYVPSPTDFVERGGRYYLN